MGVQRENRKRLREGRKARGLILNYVRYKTPDWREQMAIVVVINNQRERSVFCRALKKCNRRKKLARTFLNPKIIPIYVVAFIRKVNTAYVIDFLHFYGRRSHKKTPYALIIHVLKVFIPFFALLSKSFHLRLEEYIRLKHFRHYTIFH